MFRFFNTEYRELIYVLDFLLQVSINGEEIKASREIDLELYRLLNRPTVNQEVIHLGLFPTTQRCEKITKEYADFVHNLCIYIEYDVNLDTVWAMTHDNSLKQNNITNNIIEIRKNILSYLLAKNIITGADINKINLNPVKPLS